MKRKTMSYSEFIQYRNKIITRLNARNRTFPKLEKNKKTYYEIRLDEINELYPEYSKFGKIELKKVQSVTKLYTAIVVTDLRYKWMQVLFYTIEPLQHSLMFLEP